MSKHWNSLHPGQMKVYRHPARYKVVVAGRRWGKSRLSRTKLVAAAARKPKQLVWYIAPTYQMARQIMWQDLLEGVPRRWIKKVHETLMYIQLVNGSIIQLKGADKADTLRGVGLDYVVLDEIQDMKKETWTQVVRPTLTTTRGRALLIGTPKGKSNILYDVYTDGQRADFQIGNEWMSWHFKSIDSPFVPKSEIEKARANMDEKSFKQEYEACHLPDTEIALWGGGVSRLIDLSVGDLVTHLGEDGLVYPAMVQDIGPTGIKSCVEVELENGVKFSASECHKMKVLEHV